MSMPHASRRQGGCVRPVYRRVSQRPSCSGREGSYLRRDNVVSVLYSEGLNSTKSSVFLQRTDRHGIVGQKSSDFQRFL